MRLGRKTSALLLYVACSAAVLGPYLLPATQISRHSYDTITDGYLFMWNFWWTKHALFQLQNPYWTELLNHPFGTSLVFHSFPLTYSLMSIPFQLMVSGAAGLAVALNAASFVSFVLSSWGAYLLAFHVTRNQAGSLIAGLLFSFTQFHFLNSVNLHKAALEVLPFFVLACLRLHDKPTAVRAAALAAALAVAFYTSMELALHLVIWAGMWWVYLLATRAVNRAFVAGLGVAIIMFFAVALPLLIPQARILLGDDGPRVDQFEELAGRNNPALLSLVTPSRTHRVWGAALRSAGLGDYPNDGAVRGFRSETSLSYVMLLLSLASLLLARRKERWFWALAAGSFLVLALGPNLRLTGTLNTALPLPYELLAEILPPLRVSRDSTRFLPLAVLMLSVLSAYGVGDLLARISGSTRRRAAAIAIGAAILFEFWPQSSAKLDPEVHAAFISIRQAGGDFAVLDLRPEPYRLLAQTMHGRAVTNVRQSVPRSEAGRRLILAEAAFREPARLHGADLEAVRHDLRDNRIRFIVISLDQPTTSARLDLARRLDARIERFDGIAICELTDWRAG